jgi:hypothetical protein
MTDREITNRATAIYDLAHNTKKYQAIILIEDILRKTREEGVEAGLGLRERHAETIGG